MGDRGGDGVVDVVGIADAVAVAVLAEDRPRRGDELERPDRSVPDGVAVVATVVGVGDAGGAVGAVERDADDGGADGPIGLERGAAESTVVGLDLADPGDDLPRQPGAGRRLGGVELQQQRRDVGDGVFGRVEKGMTLRR